MRRYAQTIQDQRYTIETLVAAGWSNRGEVAEHIGIHPSTVSRELRRNASADSLWGYCAKQAGRWTGQRRWRPEAAACPEVTAEAARLAELDWSPEQVQGRVGLASELTKRNAFLQEVMLAGGWKPADMVARYAASAGAETGAVVRLL